MVDPNETVTVWRVEDANLRGPYATDRAREGGDGGTCGYRAHAEGGCQLDIHGAHPTVWEDPLLEAWANRRNSKENDCGGWHQGWRFAFPSIEDVTRWFYTSEARTILVEEGFMLVGYSVPREGVVYGTNNRQCVFNGRVARAVTGQNLEAL